MDYKKSYTGFWIWLGSFLAIYFGSVFLPKINMKLTITILDNVMTIGMFILTVIVYVTKNVYWYTGIEFEAARDAGPERRKEYALKHMRNFGIFAIIYVVYSVISMIVGIPYGIDILIATLGLIVTAASTIKYKL